MTILPSRRRPKESSRRPLPTLPHDLKKPRRVQLVFILGALSAISGSPFVLQGIYGISPQLFSVIFGMNALGLVAASQVNGRLVGRVSPGRLLAAGLTATAIGGAALLSVVSIGDIGLVGILPSLSPASVL